MILCINLNMMSIKYLLLPRPQFKTLSINLNGPRSTVSLSVFDVVRRLTVLFLLLTIQTAW